MGLNKIIIKKIIKGFITEEYKNKIYICPRRIKPDWVIYNDHESDEIKTKNFKDYKERTEDRTHIKFGVKLIEDHDCTNLLDYDAYLKNPDLCFCMYVNAGMYEEFNDYLTKYKNEKIKEYNEKTKKNLI